MTLRIIGAGGGRTGTTSLKLALEQLLGARCYHMFEVFGREGDVALWQDAVDGKPGEWAALFDGFEAAVDWPASAFWPELADAYPDAIIVHSVRDADAWWQSANSTIFPGLLTAPDDGPRGPWKAMVMSLLRERFTDRLDDEEACKEAFARHNAAVVADAPADRLVSWTASAGWEPLCAALGLPVPDEPFPHRNTSEEFNERQTKRLS